MRATAPTPSDVPPSLPPSARPSAPALAAPSSSLSPPPALLPLPPEASAVRLWLGVAIGALLLAGVLAVGLLAGRTPALAARVGDGLWLRRWLVVHVDLALLVWVHAFVASLVSALPTTPALRALSRVAALVAAGSVALLVASAVGTAARPLLANYVPLIDDDAYRAGLVAFAAAVLAACAPAWRRARAGGATLALPAAASTGLRATALALGLAAATFAIAWARCPQDLDAEARAELASWGGGHVLQAAGGAALATVWILLLDDFLGRSPVSTRAARRIFAVLVAPWLLAPWLAARGPLDPAARAAFTWLMELAIAPPLVVLLALAGLALARAARDGELRGRSGDGRLLAFLTSAALALLGFVLGALVRGSTTMIPAHYHALFGAEAAAFMAFAFCLLARLGHRPAGGAFARLAAAAPVVYGVGQTLFGIGFAFAGLAGVARKTYGLAQAARGAPPVAALAAVSVGGMVAVAAGATFVALVLASTARSRTRRARPAGAADETGDDAAA